MEKENIKIFGDHEESTLAQITRSASHEAVRGAVLCADGHKGYAVPIGGVIAYEDKISPSGSATTSPASLPAASSLRRMATRYPSKTFRRSRASPAGTVSGSARWRGMGAVSPRALSPYSS